MDHKKNPQRKPKRQSKTLEDNCWDCSVCTFRNTAEAFKCAMCDVRKGTSTRKPRLNPQLVAQQVAQQISTAPPPKPPKREESKERERKLPNNNNSITGNSEERERERKTKKKIRNIRPRLKNVDRSQVHKQPVTVNNVTVVITEFLPKSLTAIQNNPVISMEIPTSSDLSNQSEVSVNGELPVVARSSS